MSKNGKYLLVDTLRCPKIAEILGSLRAGESTLDRMLMNEVEVFGECGSGSCAFIAIGDIKMSCNWKNLRPLDPDEDIKREEPYKFVEEEE